METRDAVLRGAGGGVTAGWFCLGDGGGVKGNVGESLWG